MTPPTKEEIEAAIEEFKDDRTLDQLNQPHTEIIVKALHAYKTLLEMCEEDDGDMPDEVFVRQFEEKIEGCGTKVFLSATDYRDHHERTRYLRPCALLEQINN